MRTTLSLLSRTTMRLFSLSAMYSCSFWETHTPEGALKESSVPLLSKWVMIRST